MRKSPSTSSFAGSLSSTWSMSLHHVSSLLSWPSSSSICHQMQVRGEGATALLTNSSASFSSPLIQVSFSYQVKTSWIVLQQFHSGFLFNLWLDPYFPSNLRLCLSSAAHFFPSEIIANISLGGSII